MGPVKTLKVELRLPNLGSEKVKPEPWYVSNFYWIKIFESSNFLGPSNLKVATKPESGLCPSPKMWCPSPKKNPSTGLSLDPDLSLVLVLIYLLLLCCWGTGERLHLYSVQVAVCLIMNLAIKLIAKAILNLREENKQTKFLLGGHHPLYISSRLLYVDKKDTTVMGYELNLVYRRQRCCCKTWYG